MKELIGFFFAGGLAALVNFSSRFVFNLWLSYEVSIVLAYLLGMLVAFVLMRGRVFKKEGAPLVPQVLKFCFVNLLAVLQTLAVSMLLTYWLFPTLGVTFHPEAVAHLAGVAVPVVVSYFLHKHLTFK